MTELLIRVLNIQKKYNQKIIFDKVTYDVMSNRNVGLIGVNGSGKSTLLNIIANLDSPTTGKIHYSKNILQNKRLNLDYVSQHVTYNWGDKAKDLIDVICNLYKIDIKILKNSRIFKFFKINELFHKNFMKLSGGQRKTIEIFCVLLHKPKIVIFDELLKELDLNKQRTYLEFIKKYCKENNITILLSAHNYLELQYLVDDILIIENKKVKIVSLIGLTWEERSKKIKELIQKVFVKTFSNWMM